MKWLWISISIVGILLIISGAYFSDTKKILSDRAFGYCCVIGMILMLGGAIAWALGN